MDFLFLVEKTPVVEAGGRRLFFSLGDDSPPNSSLRDQHASKKSPQYENLLTIGQANDPCAYSTLGRRTKTNVDARTHAHMYIHTSKGHRTNSGYFRWHLRFLQWEGQIRAKAKVKDLVFILAVFRLRSDIERTQRKLLSSHVLKRCPSNHFVSFRPFPSISRENEEECAH